MEGLDKDHPYSGSSQQPPPAGAEYTVPGEELMRRATCEHDCRLSGVLTRRLRDRELLRKRKAEAQEKDTVQWVLGERGKSKGPKRGRGAGRRRGRQPREEEATIPAGPEPQPEVQEEVETEPPEKAQASPGPHVEEPILAVAPELSGGTQQEVVEGPPAEDPLHPAEHGEAPKSEEAGISEALNISLENDHTDNGYYPSVLF